MKMFTAAAKNESLAEVFKAECDSMRSHITSANPSPHLTPKKKERQADDDNDEMNNEEVV